MSRNSSNSDFGWRQLLRRQAFLGVLVAIVLVAALLPGPVELATRWVQMRYWVMLMLFFMALPLDTDQVAGALRRGHVALLAVVVGFAVPPLLLLGLPLADLGVNDEIRLGLLVAAALPTTLSSAAIWTMLAGGDVALALLCSVAANLGCVVLTPLILGLASGAAVQFDVGQMVLRLSLVVLVPTVAAQALRRLPPVARTVKARRSAIGNISRLLILVAVARGVARGMVRVGETGESLAADLAVVLVVSAFLHLATLAAASGVGRLVRLGPPQRTAMALAASQKSVVVGLYVLTEFAPFRDMALVIVPIILFHPLQLVLDSVVIGILRERRSAAEHQQ